MSVDTTAKLLMEAMRGKAGTSAYDTQATVARVDGDTLWVHIPGGVDETPVQKTVDAREGDQIRIRVGGGSAWAVGNASAPPTDDRQAMVAQGQAVSAQTTANQALETVTIQQAQVDRLMAVWAEIDTAVINILKAHGIDADWINAGHVKFDYLEGQLIRSADYATTVEALIYPATSQYPATSLYPSRGARTTSGFAIDLRNGAIYGGLFSAQVAGLEARISALENALTYPKA